MEFQLTFNVNENSPLYEGENNDTLQQSVGFALVDMLEGNEAAIKYLQDTITNIRSPNSKPARILDFGTESFGMSGADWVEESTEFVTGEHPQGLNIFAMRIRPGTPIPVPDNTYDFINLSHAIDFNEREDWPWLFDEFKRVLKKDGVMVITEGVTFSKPIAPWLKPDELFRYWTKEHFESFLKPAFPEKGNFHYRLHVDSEDGEYQRITIVIYGLNRGE